MTDQNTTAPVGTSVQVTHPETGEQSKIVLPADHDGSRVKVEFPDGVTTYTEGFDPAQRALSGEVAKVPCGKCSSPQPLTGTSFTCSACGERNSIEVRTATDAAAASSTEG